MIPIGRNGSRTAFSAATPPGPPPPKRQRSGFSWVWGEGLRPAGLLAANVLAGGGTWRREPPPPLRGDTVRKRSNNPLEATSRCIHGVLHCKEGMPCLPACRDTELTLLCHSVSKRTRP